MNWTAFFEMGGYAFYVWTSYLAAAVILVVNVLIPLRRNRTVRRALHEFYRAHEGSE